MKRKQADLNEQTEDLETPSEAAGQIRNKAATIDDQEPAHFESTNGKLNKNT
jgi:hypothetical protein